MIRLLYAEIASLPGPEVLAKELSDSFLHAYLKSHPKPTTAGLGGLWLAASAGASGELFYDEKGRPHLLDQTFCDLSISHTKEFVFCALASGKHQRIGLDAEDGGRLDEATMKKIARRFFTPTEIAEMEAAEGAKETFLAIWTKKEAYAKFQGDGLAALIAGNVLEEPCYFASASVAGNMVTICSEKPVANGFPPAQKVDFFVKHG